MTECIVFDFETNGFRGSSVLSVSAIRLKTRYEYKKKLFRGKRIVLSFEETKCYCRFYYPTERLNYHAIKVNGLRNSEINRRRGNHNYPEHFIDDQDSLKAFFNNACLYVAHNISFDSSFIPFGIPKEKQYCTMVNLSSLCGKRPKLSEAAENLNIRYNSNILHDSKEDARLCFKIFEKMANMPQFNQEIHPKLKISA
jgi:DNA polymerase-3 subunit epsilon